MLATGRLFSGAPHHRRLDDANFAVATANAAILSLTTEEEFIRTVVDGELPTVEKTPEQLDLEDSDLAVLLSNMLDNAIEGVSSVPEGQPRSIQL